MREGCMMIVIVYWFLIIKDVDLILVLFKGWIIECGIYDILIVEEGVYYFMY